MRRHVQRLLCLAVIAVPIASTAESDALVAAAGERTKEAPLRASDRRFLQEVVAGSIEAVELGKLAMQRATSQSVRVFAQRMMHDQAQLNEQLISIAEAKGIALSANLDPKREKAIETLEKLQAGAFERAYLKLMTEDYQNDIKEFRKQLQGSQDSDVKSFAAANLPKLHDDLALVREATRTAQTTSAPTRSTASALKRDTTAGAGGNRVTR
jgi:putative membrane protein